MVLVFSNTFFAVSFQAFMVGVAMKRECKGKGNVHPRTGLEGPDGEQRYSLTSALDGGGWSAPRPGRCTPGKRPSTHCTGGWVGPRASLDGCGKSCPHWDSIPGPSTP
jgi:hypothetical protein